MKHIPIMLCLTMLYGNSQAQQQGPNVLDNEEWVLAQSMEGQGTGRGSIWQFFSNHTFNATHWYSGGAYWKHQYTGTYHYDPVTATVYLKYKHNAKLPPVKKHLCIQIIDDKTDSTGYYPVFYDSWKKQKGKYVPFGEQQIIKQQATRPVDTSKGFYFSGHTTTFKKREIPLSPTEL